MGGFRTLLDAATANTLVRSGSTFSARRVTITLEPARGSPSRTGSNTARIISPAALRDAAPGYFYQAITNGFGIMNGYGAQIPPDDRWAIVACIRALQLSENAVDASLPENDTKELEEEQWRDFSNSKRQLP